MSAPPHEAIADAIAHLPAQRVAPPPWLPRPRWDPGAISTRDLLAYWAARHRGRMSLRHRNNSRTPTAPETPSPTTSTPNW